MANVYRVQLICFHMSLFVLLDTFVCRCWQNVNHWRQESWAVDQCNARHRRIFQRNTSQTCTSYWGKNKTISSNHKVVISLHTCRPKVLAAQILVTAICHPASWGPARQDPWTRGLLNAISCSFQVFSTVSVGQQVSMLKYRPEQQQQFFLLYLEFTFLWPELPHWDYWQCFKNSVGLQLKHVLLTLFLSQLNLQTL